MAVDRASTRTYSPPSLLQESEERVLNVLVTSKVIQILPIDTTSGKKTIAG